MKSRFILSICIIFFMISPVNAAVMRSPAGTLSYDKDDASYRVEYSFTPSQTGKRNYDAYINYRVYQPGSVDACTKSGVSGGSHYYNRNKDLNWTGKSIEVDIAELFESIVAQFDKNNLWDDTFEAFNAGSSNAYICGRINAIFRADDVTNENEAIVRIYKDLPIERQIQFSYDYLIWIFGIIAIIVVFWYISKNPKR